MKIWTRQADGGDWRPWSHPELGLEAVAGASPRVAAILVVGLGPPDDAPLLASIRLARRLAAGPLEVVAASAHPTLRWVESVRQAGADLALLVNPPAQDRWSRKLPLDGAVALCGAICPALHAQHEQDLTLSLCGRRQDRMLLARHHLERWCLAAKEACPHYRGASHG